MDKKLIKTAMIISVILLCGVFATAPLAIELPWEKEKKEGTSQELSPPPKIPDATPKQPSLENAKKYFDEGVAYEKDKKYNEAISSYTKAIESNRNYENAYANRGYSRRLIGNYEGALADYDKVIEINPKNSIVYFLRGYLKKAFLKDVQGALHDYNRAIEIDPKFRDAYNNRGNNKY